MALWLWLCLLAPALQVTSQESCRPEGSLTAPQLSLNVSLAHVGDTVTFRCLVPGESPMTRVIFCEDGQEAASQVTTPGRFSYDFTHRISSPGDTRDFSCWYQYKGDNNELVNSNLSTPKTLRVTDSTSSSGGGQDPTRTGPVTSLTIWAARCALVLLLLVSAPVITFILEKRGLPQPAGLEEIPREAAASWE